MGLNRNGLHFSAKVVAIGVQVFKIARQNTTVAEKGETKEEGCVLTLLRALETTMHCSM